MTAVRRRPQSVHRGARVRAQRCDVRALRGGPARPRADRADLAARPLRVLSLTVVRMLAVVIAMAGARARGPTLGFVGWFGPRGLASIVFAVIVVEESNLPHETLIVLAIYVTVGLSVLAHGMTAAPLAGRYAGWYEQHPKDEAPPLESAPTTITRPRG